MAWLRSSICVFMTWYDFDFPGLGPSLSFVGTVFMVINAGDFIVGSLTSSHKRVFFTRRHLLRFAHICGSHRQVFFLYVFVVSIARGIFIFANTVHFRACCCFCCSGCAALMKLFFIVRGRRSGELLVFTRKLYRFEPFPLGSCSNNTVCSADPAISWLGLKMPEYLVFDRSSLGWNTFLLMLWFNEYSGLFNLTALTSNTLI